MAALLRGASGAQVPNPPKARTMTRRPARIGPRGLGGGAVFKAVRGEYGTGKTFFARRLQERAKRAGFAASEVQISQTETPLHRLETIYRRLTERLSTSDTFQGALRGVLDAGFHVLEEDALAEGAVDEGDAGALLERPAVGRAAQVGDLFGWASAGRRPMPNEGIYRGLPSYGVRSSHPSIRRACGVRA
jgi:hypothetical protein